MSPSERAVYVFSQSLSVLIVQTAIISGAVPSHHSRRLGTALFFLQLQVCSDIIHHFNARLESLRACSTP